MGLKTFPFFSLGMFEYLVGRRPLFRFAVLIALAGVAVVSGCVRYAWAGFYPSYRSSFYNRREEPIISLELDAKASLNSDFRIAAREERLEDLRRFVQEGAEIDSRSDDDETALMIAARNCSEPVVDALIELGAKPDLQDDHGRTALMFAAMDDCLPVVRELILRAGADPNLRDRRGRRALDFARNAGELEYGGPAEEIGRLLRPSLRPPIHDNHQSSGMMRERTLRR